MGVGKGPTKKTKGKTMTTKKELERMKKGLARRKGNVEKLERDIAQIEKSINGDTRKVAAVKITLDRAEGLASECVVVVVEGRNVWDQADAVLLQWSKTAPKSGGYDKCDFEVVYADGETYEGRYDLKHHTIEHPDLGEHIRGFVGCVAGLVQPEWTKERGNEKHWESMKKRHEENGDAKTFLTFWNTYEIGAPYDPKADVAGYVQEMREVGMWDGN